MKNQMMFKYKGKTYYGKQVGDGVEKLINDKVIEIGINHFKTKTAHLSDQINNEGGTINVELQNGHIAFSFDGFSQNLVDQIRQALS